MASDVFIAQRMPNTKSNVKSCVRSKTTPFVSIQAGHFLAARQAAYFNDVTASADFYLAALQPDGRNPALLQQGFVTQYRNGNIDIAAA